MSTFRDWFLGTDRTPVQETRDDAPPASDPTDVRPPSRAQAPRAVTAKDALGLSLVYRSIQIHAVSSKQISVGVKRYNKPVDRVSAFIRRPNADMSRSAFLEQTVVSMASQGNAYWGLDFDNNGVIGNADVWNPNDVQIETNRKGKIVRFHHQGDEIDPRLVKHLPLMRVPGTPYGLGPIQAARVELRGALDVRDYANNWFEDSGTPDGILKSDLPLTGDQAKQARDQWETTNGGRRGVAVLGQGLDYRQVFLKPADVQFIESQQFNVTQVARLFGVPASLLLAAVDGGSKTYSNLEQDWLAYIRFSLMAYLVEIEDAFTDLLPMQQQASFNVEAFLRTDTTTRYKGYETAIRSGWRTVNEIREIENLEPLDGGDTPTPSTTKATPEQETKDA
ncbi:phage portal protein [Plantibacter sp. YIM 135347]|uniref:phage portal protein n=1 Tax=Plantibacter sp. YIM 135347 TaxID=3423919 RepID=UPI003D3401DF